MKIVNPVDQQEYEVETSETAAVAGIVLLLGAYAKFKEYLNMAGAPPAEITPTGHNPDLVLSLGQLLEGTMMLIASEMEYISDGAMDKVQEQSAHRFFLTIMDSLKLDPR